MKVLYLLMLIAGLLWIGDFSITLKPFSISLPCWYKSVGILLFWLSMTIGEFYQFNLSSCIRQQNSLTAQFVSFSLANLANIFYPPRFLQ